jgi:glucose-1-phosphate cytidylyltransferase
MKVLILAGGFGTRLAEETEIKPKPMVEIGGKPIIWHIMKLYHHYGFDEFVVLLGYKGYYIKEYFANYFLHQSDVTINLKDNSLEVHNNSAEPWKITLLDTGDGTMTGGRIKRAQEIVGNNPFMLTYGDGVSNVDIKEVLNFHASHGKKITMTTVQPEGKFGSVGISKNGQIHSFVEKPKGDGTWINGGFFVCEPEVMNYLEGDSTIFEKEPLETLAKEGHLYAYKHHGFWQCMDTIRDKMVLNKRWEQGQAAWKVWK